MNTNLTVCISEHHKIKDLGCLLMFFENYTVKLEKC